MNWWDIILLVILAYFVYRGARAGFIMTIAWFIGIVGGAWVAGHYYSNLAQIIIERIGVSVMTAIVVSFIVLYIAANIVISIIARIITMVFRLIPLATTTNRLIGAFVGLLEGALFIGLILWVMSLFPIQTAWAKSLDQSQVAKYFIATSKYVQPLLPKELSSVDFGVYNSLKSNSQDAAAQYLQQHMPALFQKLQLESSSTESLFHQLN